MATALMTSLKSVGDPRKRFYMVSTMKQIDLLGEADVVILCFDRCSGELMADNLYKWTRRVEEYCLPGVPLLLVCEPCVRGSVGFTLTCGTLYVHA